MGAGPFEGEEHMTFTQYISGRKVIYGWKINNEWLLGPFSKDAK
jgi:hypothetical protein